MSDTWHCDWNTHYEGIQNIDTIYPYEGNSEKYKQISEECKDKYCCGKMTKCPNFKFCGNSHPLQLLNAWGGRCLDCDMEFYTNLNIHEKSGECVICAEDKCIFVEFPGCNKHEYCMDCFKMLWFGKYEFLKSIEILVSTKDYDSDYRESLKRTYLNTTNKCPLCRHQHIPSYMCKNDSQST